jgi:Protein of unknown function (DUF1573)
MKKLILFTVIALFGFTAQAQTGPKIEFKDKDNTIDYGNVTKDTDSGVRVFEFTNTGDADLIITNVQSTCGCTVPTKPTEPIKPGKTGKIEVKYNMNPGPIRKTITVESNATNYEGGKIPIKIKGTVIVPEEVNILAKKKSMME